MITTEGFESRKLRRIGGRVRIGSSIPVFFAIVLARSFNSILEDIDVLVCRIPIDEHWADAGAQEMVGATCAQRAELIAPISIRRM